MYTVEFVRIRYPSINRKNAGSFTKTFNTIDELIKFNLNSDRIRIKGALKDVMSKAEYDIYFNKMCSAMHKKRENN